MSLIIEDLRFQRGSQEFGPIDCTLNYGEMLYLSGENGSGKTSLLMAIAGILSYHTGYIRLFDDLLKAQQLCYCADNAPFDKAEHADKIINFYRRFLMYNNKEECFLSDNIISFNTKNIINNLSAGQLKRLQLYTFLSYRRPVWILDEPDNALDQSGIEILCSSIETYLTKHNGIVLWAGHHDPCQYSKSFKKLITQRVEL